MIDKRAKAMFKTAKSVVLRNDGSIAFAKFESKKGINPVAFIRNHKERLGLNADGHLASYQTHRDPLGFTSEKFKQYYKGVEVLNATAIFHQKAGAIVSMNGRIMPHLEMDIQANLKEEVALKLALANINAKQYRWEQEHTKEAPHLPVAKLGISSKDYSFLASEMRLVYVFDIYALQPLGRYHIEVDAQSGAIVNKYNLIHHNDVPASGASHYNGTVHFTADSMATNLYRLRNDAKNITTQSLKNGYYPWQDAEDVVSNDRSFAGDSVQTAVSAHWATEAAYDYFFDRFGLSGYNGGMAINAFVNYGNNQANAFWDGFGFYYGDGGHQTTPHVCLDIVGHEYTHAITYFSGGLIYQNEQGALNESFSDIFGHNIEVYKNPSGASWSAGSEVFPNGGSYREMSNPKLRSQPDTYHGEHWEYGSIDHGGVHTNSGVQNYWYYLIAEGGSGVNDKGYHYQVSGIGLEKAAQIAYRNLTVYITPS
ncbi:MAG: M4 family metallopeptidase, partial [Bacteroidota bacterium]